MQNDVGAEVTGVVQLQKRLHTVEGECARGMERGLVKAAQELLSLTQQVVPVDTGRLKASGFVRKVGSGFSTEMSVGYTTHYAIFVHEDLTARHKEGQIAKYIERPAAENADRLMAIIRDEAQVGKTGAIPEVADLVDVSQHALLPISPRGPGSAVRLHKGTRVGYVRMGRSKSGVGGWRRKR